MMLKKLTRIAIVTAITILHVESFTVPQYSIASRPTNTYLVAKNKEVLTTIATNSRQKSLEILPPLNTTVIIVGGGIAGLWTSLHLAEQNIPSILISSDPNDHTGSTFRAVGAINIDPIHRLDFATHMEELGMGQENECITQHLQKHLAEELTQLEEIVPLVDIKLGKKPGSTTVELMEKVINKYYAHGGKVIHGRLTRIVVDDDDKCRGIQYQDYHGQGIGKICAPCVVLATGGYASLFEGCIPTQSYGTGLGRFLQCGGIACNLEFVWKHGYGKPDQGQLTPTEELPGAEISSDKGHHVELLERQLYDGTGTQSHLNACKHWRRNKDETFYIDKSPCRLYQALCACNLVPAKKAEYKDKVPDHAKIEDVASLFIPHKQQAMRQWIQQKLVEGRTVTYEEFCDMKKDCLPPLEKAERFRVRQITYFSMGGVAHKDFESINVNNVYATGEVMHDFGGNRVGGLPWALYLVAGGVIAKDIAQKMARGELTRNEDFDLVIDTSSSDKALLTKIQHQMYTCLEMDTNPVIIEQTIVWLREMRKALQDRPLDEAHAWLLVAEAILVSALHRKESRGSFFRTDYPFMSKELNHLKSYTVLDTSTNQVCSVLTDVGSPYAKVCILPQDQPVTGIESSSIIMA